MFLWLTACSLATTTDVGTPVDNSTATPSPTPTIRKIPTQTNTPTVTPTWTLVTTISQETKKRNLQELLLSNGGCDFPCWWGIEPGTSLQDVIALASILGESPHIFQNQFSYTISFDELNLPDLDVTFFGKEEIVQAINVRLIYPSRHPDYYDALHSTLSLNSVLNKHGKPSKVMFLVEPRVEPNSPISYAIFLAYETQGFGIEYSGLVDVEDPVKVCSIKISDDHLREISLYIQDPADKIKERNQFHTNEFQSLELYTSMSLDEFSETFAVAENDNCIETSFDHWK